MPNLRVRSSGRAEKRYTDARSVLVAIMANPMAVDTDAVLETMTTNLLQVSSVFLMQQNELQEVRDRLAKELKRVDTILETLTQAAQQHQDAVLSAVQNYETLAVAHEEAMAQVAATSEPPAGANSEAGAIPPGLPPNVSRLSTGSSIGDFTDAANRASGAGLTPSPNQRPSLG